MFQYAAGRALALNLADSFKLDTSGFVGYGLHQGFELDRVFSCELDIASRDEVCDLLGWRSKMPVRRILMRQDFALFRGAHFVIEPHFHYWRGINKTPRNSYISGYWQSEQYFQDHISIIRSDFKFKIPFSEHNAELAKKIGQVNAVSLHVRRGDYAANPIVLATHGLCSLQYYKEAIRFVSERVNEPYFFIFSDDIEWVKDNLEIGFQHQYIDHNYGLESYNDMRLMSLCQHHIIANSSFSWWGAWLNPSPAKLVVSPEKWFSNDNQATDLIPREWVRL